MSAALVPVKALEAGKSRLLPALPRGALAELCLAMMEDLLASLGRVPSLDRVVVVTPDHDVAVRAEAAGATAFLHPPVGLVPSLDAACAPGAPGADDPLLVVLGDLPGARAEEVERLFEALRELGEPAAVLAPAEDGGTAALLRTPRDAFPSRFGPGSAEAHRRAASAAGVPLRELALPSLAVDLDRPEDVDRFLREAAAGGASAPGARTRALLRSLGWKEAR